MTLEAQLLLKERNITFRSGNRAHCSTAEAKVKRGIRKAKSDFRLKI